MVWGSNTPEVGGRSVRAETMAAQAVDEDAIRTANQMREAGLKWRPSFISPIVVVLVGLIVLSVLYAYLR